ncbi:MAG: hypothetical protein R2746_00480 [Acidimicrobiales bacterium]
MADDDRAPAQTLVDLIERRRHDHRVGLVLHDHVWTWAGAVAESDRWGAAIDAAIGPTPPNGVRHLGLLVENTPEYLLALLGAARRGITTVGLNTTRRRRARAGHRPHRLRRGPRRRRRRAPARRPRPRPRLGLRRLGRRLAPRPRRRGCGAAPRPASRRPRRHAPAHLHVRLHEARRRRW